VLGCAIPMATIMLQSRNIGQRGREEGEDETTRKNGMGAKVSRVQRSVRLCEARPALPEGVGSWKEIDVGKGCYRQRGGRVIENLTRSNSDETDESG
jgi:hypothetical protein